MNPGSVRTLTTLAAALIGAAGLVLAAYIGASSHREAEALREEIARLELVLQQQKQGELPTFPTGTPGATDSTPKPEPNPSPTPHQTEPIASESESPPDNAAQQSTNRQIVKEMLFELSRCEADGTTVWCHFTLENRTPSDRRVQLEVMELSSSSSKNSRVFDGGGNEYHATGGSLAGSTVLDWEGYSFIRTTAPPQVPLKAGIRFEGIPEGSKIRLLRIVWGDQNYDRFPVDFRDPTVTRRE